MRRISPLISATWRARLNKWLYIALAAVAFGGFFYWKGCTRRVPPQSSPAVLKEDEAEIILLDPTHRTITTVTHAGTSVRTLPDRPTSVTVKKTGEIVLNSPQMGLETRPYIGIGWAGQLNDYIGLDFFYWKRLDVGFALGFDRDLKIKSLGLPLTISYSVYHNTRISIGYELFGPSRILHGLVSVRL